MTSFKNIPHVVRKIYRRTFMNEIILFFAYDRINVGDKMSVVESLLLSNGCKRHMTESAAVFSYEDNNVILSFISTGVFVSIPSKQYRDFHNTSQIWKNLGVVLEMMQVVPGAWTFTKGNRFIFGKSIPEVKFPDVYRLVLSAELIDKSGEEHIFMEESVDKSYVFSCRYGMEKYQGQDSLSLKTVLISSVYSCKGLKELVFARNDDMFDCWHWCMNPNIIGIMEKEV